MVRKCLRFYTDFYLRRYKPDRRFHFLCLHWTRLLFSRLLVQTLKLMVWLREGQLHQFQMCFRKASVSLNKKTIVYNCSKYRISVNRQNLYTIMIIDFRNADTQNNMTRTIFSKLCRIKTSLTKYVQANTIKLWIRTGIFIRFRAGVLKVIDIDPQEVDSQGVGEGLLEVEGDHSRLQFYFLWWFINIKENRHRQNFKKIWIDSLNLDKKSKFPLWQHYLQPNLPALTASRSSPVRTKYLLCVLHWDAPHPVSLVYGRASKSANSQLIVVCERIIVT